MGGDEPPESRVRGAVEAARRGGVEVQLVGRSELIDDALHALATEDLPITVVAAGDAVPEGTHPALALRQQSDAAVFVAAERVRDGHADAVASAGNTGASMAASHLILGTLPGIDRVAAGGPVLGPLAPHTVILDGGANVDVRPGQFVVFAVLGAAYARHMLGIDDPKIALLSNGAERGKGSKQVKEAYPLLEASGLRFVGQVEGHDLVGCDADVVVCDGFVGNVLIKFWEAVAPAVVRYALDQAGDALSAEARARAEAASAELSGVADRGGPLLGTDGVFVVGHGRAGTATIAEMVHTAADLVRSDFVGNLRRSLEAAIAGVGT